MTFDELFRIGTTYPHPRYWQRTLAEDARCTNRLINIGTGLGKTEGVIFAWLWNRVIRQDPTWPRRLVWCLPMRVLVEQTAERLEMILSRLAGHDDIDISNLEVHRLLGGAAASEWPLSPGQDTILVGTQDMLLSRGLNRGYASKRARWPIEYGLLNQDALWVMDEVQLMDVGLITSVQMQMYRESAPLTLRPSWTWWMSATLQSDWLETPESRASLPSLQERMLSVSADDRADLTWQAHKTLRVQTISARGDRKHTALARLIWDEHSAQARPSATIVVVNRVDSAMNVARELSRAVNAANRATEIKLVHSRFRVRERREWPAAFLNRAATEHPTADRIIVATQVIEAGVDISCATMITELAPLPNLVQRFGRVARYGGAGRIVVVDRDLSSDDALPYDEASVAAAREALAKLSDAGLQTLLDFESSLPEAVRRALYPYEPLHVLTPREYEELFDTTTDLSGADVDISRFIRTSDDRDLSVAWIDAMSNTPGIDVEPGQDDLCPVPVGRARDWLFDGNGLKDGCRAWVWDYLDGEWRRPDRRDLYPGQVVVVSATWGGYDIAFGFSGEPAKSTGRVEHPIVAGIVPAAEASERAEEGDDASESAEWKTIATHGLEVGAEARRICADVGLPPSLCQVADLAGRLHDWGKSHGAFRASIRSDHLHDDIRDVAKAPRAAWVNRARLYPETAGATVRRRGFRHELASMLAILELLASTNPAHAGLAQRCEFNAVPKDSPVADEETADGLSAELSALSPDDLNLLLYFVCSHHGKIRMGLHPSPHDQEYPIEHREPERGLPLRGVREWDGLPITRLYDDAGRIVETPTVTLHLDIAAIGLSPRYGPSWIERVISIRRRFGPGGLAFLEALFRAADVRATRLPTPDPLIQEAVLS
jgi:CRISPR-associated endonuclease/helicase Cas3